MIIIGIVISFIIGVCLGYFICRPRNIEIQQLNENTKLQNRLAAQELAQKAVEIHEKQKIIEDLDEQKSKITQEISDQKKSIDAFFDLVREDKIKLLNEEFDRVSEELSKEYREQREDYQQEYLQTLQDAQTNFTSKIQEKQIELESIQNELNKAIAKQKAIIESNKREEEKLYNFTFYTLQISDEDKKEIKKLKEIADFFRSPQVLYKIIWKTYYEKAFTDLIGRITDTPIVCGIYKITNLNNKKVYIGQSTNIKERLRTHIKKGLGADTPGNNKLYKAMFADGVENFLYEIIEKCPREELNDKERYWITYFGAQEYGYNETKGGS